MFRLRSGQDGFMFFFALVFVFAMSIATLCALFEARIKDHSTVESLNLGEGFYTAEIGAYTNLFDFSSSTRELAFSNDYRDEALSSSGIQNYATGSPRNVATTEQFDFEGSASSHSLIRRFSANNVQLFSSKVGSGERICGGMDLKPKSPSYRSCLWTPPPACTLVASPSSVTSGQTVTLTYSPLGGVITSAIAGAISLKVGGDSFQDTPASNTTYTVAVNGIAGSSQCQTTVAVSAPPVSGGGGTIISSGPTIPPNPYGNCPDSYWDPVAWMWQPGIGLCATSN